MFTIDADITRARTLPARFYLDDTVFAAVRERVFARSWQWVGDLAAVQPPGSMAPRMLAPGALDEPVLLVRDGEGTLRCLSNVCTHRGHPIVAAPCQRDHLRCPYHSRRFDLAGRVTFMPGFEGAQDFPGPRDHLPQLPFGSAFGHGFASLAPVLPLDEMRAASPEHGQRVAAYYWWLFPNLMLNLYPWGLSLNLVQPLAPDLTRVSFRAYVARPELLGRGAGGALDQVEQEDEAAVKAVQRGLRSRLYESGRYSPQHERGVHQFHRLLAGALAA